MPEHGEFRLYPIITGLVMAVLIASANYVINEYLDRDFDALHPKKSLRRAVQRQMDGRVVWLLWLTLVVAGVGIVRKSVGEGRRVCVRVGLGGRRSIKKNKKNETN